MNALRLFFSNFTYKFPFNCTVTNFVTCDKSGAVLVLHTPYIKYIFEIYLGIICIQGRRKQILNGPANNMVHLHLWRGIVSEPLHSFNNTPKCEA